MQQTPPPSISRTYLVGCDNRSDIRIFSGITYHLGMQGMQDGLLTGTVNLYPRGIGAWRVYIRAGLWKLSGGLRGRRGFRLTDGYLDDIWRRGLPALRGSTVINNHQLFGSHFLCAHQAFGVVPYAYVDGTLGEWFRNYRAFDTSGLDEAAMRRAVVLERDGYASCRRVVVMSKRAAADLVQNYDVPQEKIHIVPPGANIPERLLESLESRPESRRRPGDSTFVIGFIGYQPERKGLPTIAEAVQLLRGAGYDVRLHIIGNCPPDIAQRDGVTHFGVVDKSVEMDRFIEIVRNLDIGCMLSRAEMAGIALLEFLRMGVPVIATDVGGIPDIVDLGAGYLVPPQISPSDLARSLAGIIDEPGQLAELQEGAWHRRHNASWCRVVHELKGVLNQ